MPKSRSARIVTSTSPPAMIDWTSEIGASDSAATCRPHERHRHGEAERVPGRLEQRPRAAQRARPLDRRRRHRALVLPQEAQDGRDGGRDGEAQPECDGGADAVRLGRRRNTLGRHERDRDDNLLPPPDLRGRARGLPPERPALADQRGRAALRRVGARGHRPARGLRGRRRPTASSRTQVPEEFGGAGVDDFRFNVVLSEECFRRARRLRRRPHAAQRRLPAVLPGVLQRRAEAALAARASPTAS